MIQENQRLKAQLEASEQARSRQGREVAELKRQLGMISLDELESLDVVGPSDSRRIGSGYTRERERSVGGGPGTRSSGPVAAGGASTSMYGNGVRIPGTTISSSFSPPSSFMSRRAGNGGFSSSYTSQQQQHYYLGPSSRGSSLNTAFTTPSSSYPQPFPPPTSPASSVTSWNALGFPPSAFSGTRAPPPSSAGSTSSYLRSPSARRRRRSLSGGTQDGQGIDEESEEQASTELYEADEDDRDGDDPSGGLTPLSISPGSRSGSLSRRTSVSLQSAGAGSGISAGNAGATESPSGVSLTNTTATKIGG